MPWPLAGAQLGVQPARLCGDEPWLPAAALQALALLAREHSPRLQALGVRTLDALLGMLRQPPTPEALLAALAAVAYLSDAYPAHRWASRCCVGLHRLSPARCCCCLSDLLP